MFHAATATAAQPPAWGPLDDGVEPALRGWLSARGSLTQRLRARCVHGFELRLVGQQPIRMSDEEAALVTASSRDAVVREVHMMCGAQRWVYGATIIPEETRAREPWIETLGERPLGESLLERADVTRGEFGYVQLHDAHAMYHRAVDGITSPPPHVWARRSVIELAHSGLIVHEVFLPDAERCAVC